MGSLLLLIGLMMLMMGLIWTAGEALKQDLLQGAVALVAAPIYSGYCAFALDYTKWSRPFFVNMFGVILVLIGYFIGV